MSKGNLSSERRVERLSEQWWASRTPEVRARRCTAHRSDRSGERCKNAALVYQHVCRFHGGASQRAKNAATRRLGEAADTLVKRLLGFALDGNVDDAVALRAMLGALDRAGLTVAQSVEVNGEVTLKPFDEILASMSGVASITREESRRRRGIESPPALAMGADDLAALTQRDILDVEVVDEAPTPPADRLVERRNRPKRASGRPKRAESQPEPEGDGIPPGYLDRDEASARAHKSNVAAGVYSDRKRRGGMNLR
jgi:hypothetical protein